MEISPTSSRALSALLETFTGQTLSPSRQWRIGTALSGVLRETGASSVDELVAKLSLAPDPSLSRRVVEALLNNETYFFRDRTMFDQLTNNILPELNDRRRDSRTLSIWSAGCSTGQEALSLAMIFAEQERLWAGWSIDILATDVSRNAISAAKTGSYSQFEIQRGLGVNQMMRWFEPAGTEWRAQPGIHRRLRFAVHNLLDIPPANARFDLVLCRNVLLYFDVPTRTRAFQRLASAMRPDGWLMLGAGETVVGQTDCFAQSRIHSGMSQPTNKTGSVRDLKRSHAGSLTMKHF